MSMDLSNFKLLKEDDNFYQVGHPNGKAITVNKKGLNERAHSAIKKMKGASFDDGGETGVDSTPKSFASQMASVPEPTVTQPTQAPVQAAPDPISEQASELNEGLETYKGAINKSEQAQTNAANMAAQAYGEALTGVTQKNQELEDNILLRKAKDESLERAYRNSEVDPDRYWHNKSTGSKVFAGIGMLLSGMGSATTGQPNLAMENINGAINRDVEAQKNDQSKSMNLWKMNREAMHSDEASTLQTQNQLLLIAKLKADQAAALAQAPIAQQKNAELKLQIDQQMASNRFKIAMMTQGQKPGQSGQLSQADPAQLVTSMVGEKHQAKAFDEIDAAQNTVKNAPGIIKAFNDAASGIHTADFVPGMQNVDQKALHTLLGPTFKDVEGTVRQAAMDNLFSNITPQFGDNTNTINTKRAALEGYLRSKSAAPVTKGHGIDLTRFQGTNIELPGAEVERIVPGGRVGLFDSNTKKFLRYK